MNIDNEALPAILQQLNYDARWLTYGFVDGQFLQEQAARFKAGADSHTEHYRWAAFLRILEAHPTFDDATLSRYVELVALDPDLVMATSALIRLIRSGRLTDHQRSWLRAQSVSSTTLVQRAFT